MNVEYNIFIVGSDLKRKWLKAIKSTNPRNTLNREAIKRYGPRGFTLIPDDTIIGIHATEISKEESMFIK